jgi:uncharacterized protein YjiS (DUF1127 family)
MAQLNAALSGDATLTLTERAQALVANLKDAVRRRSVYRRTLRELNALTEREMTDLGIHAAMISQVAREAAYGK